MTQVAIVVYPGMTALDAVGPYELLNLLEGRELRFVSNEVGPIVTDSAALVLGATHTFAETPSPDVVLVPGSSHATAQRMADTETTQWLREVHPRTTFTTSVCSGALVLAAAGLLSGLSATTHWAGMPLLSTFGVTPRPDARVVREGKIFTAAGVSAGIDLALTLFAELEGDERAKRAQLMIEYDPRPPFDSGHMHKAAPETRKSAKRAMARASVTPQEVGAIPKVLLTRFKQLLSRAPTP